jgi:hypothetical protein
MAKILEEKPWAWIFECRSCHTKIEAGIDDIECAYFGANYGGDSPQLDYYVTCPVCGTDNQNNYRVAIPPKAKEGAATRLEARREATRRKNAEGPKSEYYKQHIEPFLKPVDDSKPKES